MKKKTTRKTAAKRSTRRTTKSSSSHLLLLPFSFRRVIFITTAIALFLGVVVMFNKNQVTQSVAGISVMKGLFAEARVDLPQIEGAVSYNIYYKKDSAGEYTNVARNIPAGSLTYTISYLKKGEAYRYKVSAVNSAGAEFYWTAEENLTNIEPM